jgi:peptidoglycan/LPS O-acetylase OafA/YrhL
MLGKNTLFLTGLRGYSALAVFLIHSGGGARGINQWWDKAIDFGKYGVISFFVLSAFTLSMSIDRATKFSYVHYLLRRFARITPIYFIAIFILWLLGGNNYYQEMFSVKPHNIFDLMSHLTFMNLWDVRYQNTVIGVEWTMPIEMWTYLLIPPIFFFIMRSKLNMGWFILFVLIVISAKNQLLYQGELIGLRSHWAIETYLYCFVGGIVAYKIYSTGMNFSEKVADISVGFILILIGLLCIQGEYFSDHWQAYLISFSPKLVYVGGANPIEQLFTLLFLALILVLSQARSTRILFENRPIILLGNISFPFYLFHFSILQFFESLKFSNWQLFFASLFTTAVIAFCCHVLIEKPVLKLSGNILAYNH